MPEGGDSAIQSDAVVMNQAPPDGVSATTSKDPPPARAPKVTDDTGRLAGVKCALQLPACWVKTTSCPRVGESAKSQDPASRILLPSHCAGNAAAE